MGVHGGGTGTHNLTVCVCYVLQYNVLQLRASVRQCEVQSTKNTLLDVALHWIQQMLRFLHM